MKLEFSQQIFEKNIQIPNFIKSRPVPAELLHADGRTGRQDEVIIRFFCNFA
jgi:hypothetical protein